MKLVNAITRHKKIMRAVEKLYEYIDSLPSPAREKALEYQRNLILDSGRNGGGYRDAILSRLSNLGSRFK